MMRQALSRRMLLRPSMLRTTPHRAAFYATPFKAVAVGDAIPSGIELDFGFNPIEKIDIAERCKNRKLILLGLPGAFTPC